MNAHSSLKPVISIMPLKLKDIKVCQYNKFLHKMPCTTRVKVINSPRKILVLMLTDIRVACVSYIL